MPNNYYENSGNTQNSAQIPEIKPSQTPEEIEPQSPQEEEQINIEESTPDEVPPPGNISGQLTVSAFTANQLSPVTGATVSISAQGSEAGTVLDSSVTDRSGRSKTFTLPAPSAAISQEPSTLAPAAVYQVFVSHPDFYDFIAENVQVFEGITTQLPVNLIPLPELPNGDTTKIVIIPKQNL